MSSSHIAPPALRESTHLPLGCPRCGGPVDLRTRHIEVRGSAIRMYCSKACQRRDDPRAAPEPAPPVPRSRARVIALPALVAGGLATLGLWAIGGDEEEAALADGERSQLADFGPPRPEADEVLLEHGPSWPPSEAERIEMLADGAWLHPLQGPKRRMPIRASRAFGAYRPGSRPAECRAGHCGLDLGGERWGEPVLAVQDGVVERVIRDPGANGGRYVWLAHRDGTVFTHYFHLAAIPPDLREGQEVRRGQTIGLLGASGVKHSGPHLHFTVAVKLPGDRSRQYIDPEPLISLWPLQTPVSCETATVVSTDAPPGRVIGAQSRAPRRIAARNADPEPQSEASPESSTDASRVASTDDETAADGDDARLLRPLSRIAEDADASTGDEGTEPQALPGFTR